MRCPRCSQDNLPDSRFCQNCGRPLKSPCTRCGTDNAPDAKFCKQCGSPLSGSAHRLEALQEAAPLALRDKARSAIAGIEGERKPVTILFTDIVGSTSLAEKRDPEEWKEIVSGAHRRVGEAIYRYEGTIAQLLGDGVLAFFGAPITHEDDPIRAARAGLDIQAAIEAYAGELKGYLENFQLRVGINTGIVVVGNVGNDTHMEYLAIGDAVNLAARLESACQPGHVLISDATAKLVKAEFELNALGEIRVKGKAEPVSVFGVVDRKVAPSSRHGIEGLASPLVGREEELTALQAALRQLPDGHGHIVSILGEAGIGKTRLMEEARLDPSLSSLHWLEGRSLSYGQTLSFWAITQLLQNDLGLSDGDPEPRIKAALRKRVHALFGDRAGDLLPHLERLMGVEPDGEVALLSEHLDGETLRREVLWAMVEYFEKVSEEQPTVLVLEDLHWADPSTLQALQGLLGLTDRSPVCVLLLSRIDRDHGSWQLKLRAETDFAHRYTDIQLKPLAPEHSAELVRQLMAVADLPEALRRAILERSEGNPFYLEEIIRSLIDQGSIVRDGGAWRTGAEIASAEIPDTLQGVLLARIDRLPEDVRSTLQLAAVIGKSFLYRILKAISATELPLDGHLSKLQRADLVREKTRRPELEYIFRHSLTQQAAYNSLLLERRKEFHRKVGEALEQLFSARQEDFYSLLAHHFDAAGDGAKAVEYLIKAGDTARRNDAFEEAIRDYERVIELLEQAGDTERLCKTWLKIGLIHQVNFRFERAHEANETAFALQTQLHPGTEGARIRTSDGGSPQVFRLGYSGVPISTLDPSLVAFTNDVWASRNLFAGLAELDPEGNVVPHVARSWQVLDGGTRYVLHLRDDVRWTDGTSVTAYDFEWTWKRNLAPGSSAPMIGVADDIAGESALDAHTLDVRLNSPISYFLYLLTTPPLWPLPRAAVERYGSEWWKAGNIVSNGPFELVEFDATHGLLKRNRTYFDDFAGNVEKVEWTVMESNEACVRGYQAGEFDEVPRLNREYIPSGIPANEIRETNPLMTAGLTLVPDRPPLDDVRVRQAIAHAIDRQLLGKATGLRYPAVHGGTVPPGLAGHSPELGLAFDPERARRLLAEAGHPSGKSIPRLKCYTRGGHLQAQIADVIAQQLQEHLGIHLNLAKARSAALPPPMNEPNVLLGTWDADYPDPDNFLRQSSFYRVLSARGWHHARLEGLLKDAASTADRACRLSMYREADRILVNEEVVMVPVSYSERAGLVLLKPWVKGVLHPPDGWFNMRDVLVEPH